MKKLANIVAMLLLFWGIATIDSVGFWFKISILSIFLGILILCISFMVSAIIEARESEVFYENR